MNIAQKALKELFPDKKRNVSLKYSKRFNPFNANVRYDSRNIEFRFSREWKGVAEEIQIGLAQHLLLKAFKKGEKTVNVELYEKFIEKLPNYIDNSHKAPAELVECFDRVNERYFDGFLERPGLEWGSQSFRQLGRYSYHTDTVRVSTIFRDLEEEKLWMLDYVMYHELLHKKLGVKHGKNGSCRHHTPEFRKLESLFEVKDAEEKLSRYVSRFKRRGVRNIFK